MVSIITYLKERTNHDESWANCNEPASFVQKTYKKLEALRAKLQI